MLTILGYSQNQQKADSIKKAIATNSSSLNVDELMLSYYWLSAYSNEPDEKLKYGKLLLELSKNTDNLEYQIKGYTRVGVSLRYFGDLTEALENLFSAADLAIGKREYVVMLAEIYAEISTCYTQYGDTQSALQYGRKTINILQQTENKLDLALTQLNFGYDLYLANQYDSALAYYAAAEPVFRDMDLAIGLAYLKGNRALVDWKKGQLEQAKQGLFDAITMLEPFGDVYAMADYYNQIGYIFLDENKPNEAMMYANKSVALGKSEGLKEQIRDASEVLYLANSQIGDLEDAFVYQTQYHAYNDSIQNLKINKRLANLRTEFELNQKQSEVDLLLAQKRNDQLVIISGTIILAVVLILVVIVFLYLKTARRHLHATELLNKNLNDKQNELVTLNATKDKLFSIISHDLRGPVAQVSQLISLNKKSLESKQFADIEEQTNQMSNSVEGLLKLLDSVLKWGLQQMGQIAYMPKVTKIRPVITEAIEQSQDMARAKDIVIELACSENSEVFVDKISISTVFRNLINNAIKFTEQTGEIKIVVEDSSKNGYTAVKISDNGIGIKKETLQNLFSLKAISSTKGTYGETGTGLGLLVVKEFVEKNQGILEVESEIGKGTTFTLHFPKNAEQVNFKDRD